MAGFLAGLIGKGAAEPIEAIGNIVDGLFTSDEERLDKQTILARIGMQPRLVQMEINKIEAQHRSIFVAGWRPFIGWVCGLALAYNFIARDLLVYAITVIDKTVPAPPALQLEHLMTVLVGLLGLGGLRTVEKLKGRAK